MIGQIIDAWEDNDNEVIRGKNLTRSSGTGSFLVTMWSVNSIGDDLQRFCSGVLITDSWIASAAACLEGFKGNYETLIGIGSRKYRVVRLEPEYGHPNVFKVLLSEFKFDYGNAYEPIDLPTTPEIFHPQSIVSKNMSIHSYHPLSVYYSAELPIKLESTEICNQLLVRKEPKFCQVCAVNDLKKIGRYSLNDRGAPAVIHENKQIWGGLIIDMRDSKLDQGNGTGQSVQVVVLTLLSGHFFWMLDVIKTITPDEKILSIRDGWQEYRKKSPENLKC